MARFKGPSGSVVVGPNLFVTDTYNNTIRKVVIATGEVSTFAGTRSFFRMDGTGAAAGFNYPHGITTDGANLFVTDGNGISTAFRKIAITTGEVTSLSVSALPSDSTSGTGNAARFNMPLGITTDGTNLFVTDTDNTTIRQIVIATGVVTTLAGAADRPAWIDGNGTAAHFDKPYGITSDGTNLFVADFGNHTVRKIVIATGSVTTLAGSAYRSGNSDGAGATASFNQPTGITTDGTNLFVADSGNHTIRKIVIATGVVTTLEGTAWVLGSTNVMGRAAVTSEGITTNGTSLFIADTNNGTIRKIVIASGMVTTLAGIADGSDGAGAAAAFALPNNVTTDGTSLFATDGSAIRKIVIATRVVTTLAGAAGTKGSSDGTGANARFHDLSGITTDGTNLFVTDRSNHTIRKIVIATGEVTTLAGTPSVFGDSVDGKGADARFSFPNGITTDGSNLFVSDTGNYTIRKIVIATGVVTTLAGKGKGGFYHSGNGDGIGTDAELGDPWGITTDGTSLFVTDERYHNIRTIFLATGAVSTFAGTAQDISRSGEGSSDGTRTAASFDHPRGITTDGTNLFVVDFGNHIMRKIVIATGVVTTFAGTAHNIGSSDGTGASASFFLPNGITTDGTNLFVTDSGNATIRKIE